MGLSIESLKILMPTSRDCAELHRTAMLVNQHGLYLINNQNKTISCSLCPRSVNTIYNSISCLLQLHGLS